MPEFLKALDSRGAVLGLVTGNLSRIGWKKMELAGLREYFSVGAFAEDGRTRARLAQVAAQRAKREGLVAWDCRIALIGDHPNDVAAAKANGFLAIAVATGVIPREELQASEPDILVETVSDLPLEAVS
jgi:phosphoglycolate phosphatase-like HAD superfamily hydrolase